MALTRPQLHSDGPCASAGRHRPGPCATVLLAAAIMWGAVAPVRAQSFQLASPDGRIEATITAGRTLALSIRRDGRPVVATPPIGLEIEGRLRADALPAVSASDTGSIDQVIRPAVAEKRARIRDRYRQLRLSFGPELAATFRAYDDGVAYRFETALPGEVAVRDERAGLVLDAGDTAWIAFNTCRREPGVDCFHSSYEENYQERPVGELPPGRLAFLPVVFRTAGGYLGFTESDLRDYAGLWLRPAPGEAALRADFPRLPLRTRSSGGEYSQQLVVRRSDLVARTRGTRTWPWRVFAISPDAAGLLGNDLVYRLAGAQELEDASWIRPGLSTDDWITDRVLYGVDFASGFNTATYRHYIDFAHEYGVDYMMFDAGWSDPHDNTRLHPDIDVPGLIAHANEKGVGILLWNEAEALSRNLEQALDRYAAWGARGIMVDFMDRDDQPMLALQERIVRAAAARRLLVNFHGVAKPTGLQRAWPNLITREAVLGHEYDKWSDRATPAHAVTAPFVRMLAGPMDWEGGSIRNATREAFRAVGSAPMSQGTRTQQLAQYVVYDSPLQYLGGSPSDYRTAPAFTRFLAELPTTWDETVPLQGEIGRYLAIARRAGDAWYVAAMGDWSARTLELPLAFLPPGRYAATIVRDGENADRHAEDFRIESRTLDAGDALRLRLAPGGGYVAKFVPAARVAGGGVAASAGENRRGRPRRLP